MKILLISQYFPPEVGATQTRMLEFARHLHRCGHEVYVVCEIPNHPSGIIPEAYRKKWYYVEQYDGITILHTYVLTSPRKTPLTRIVFYVSFMLSGLLGGLALPKCNVIFATSPPLFVGVIAYALSRIRRTPYVLDIRDLWPAAAVALGELSQVRLIRIAEYVERFLYRHATVITAVTQGFCRQIRQLDDNEEKVKWLPNGTIPSLFKPSLPSEELKRTIGTQGHFVVTFAGTHGIAQGLLTLLDCAEQLESHPDIRFLFIGDGPIKSRLISTVQEKALSNVIFHNQVPLDLIPSYIAASDLLVVPLRKDAIFEMFIPSKLFDFMACAKPVILSVPGEARQILEQANAGRFIEPENPEQLASVILELKSQPELCRQYGQNGRAFVLQHFSREKTAVTLEKALTEVVHKIDPPQP